MRTLSGRLASILPHVLAWVAFAAYEQAIVLLTDGARPNLLHTLLLYALNIGVFYGNGSWLLPRLYARRHYLGYVAAVLLLLASYGLVRSVLNHYWVPETGSFWRMWALGVYRSSFFVFLSAGYWFARTALQLATQRRMHERQLREAERSLFEANLSILKSQINPHFFFNALNFLYAEVYPHSENAARAIVLLSETMRYALQEDSQDKVLLEKEVQHLRNYIDINQLRFHNQLQLRFECSGSLHFLLIPPLVLITFVENCFKHGELTDPADPLLIRLDVVENQLTFYTHNRKRVGLKEPSTGIGLANTRKRLAIMYPERHQLLIDDTPTHYTCTLRLAL